MLECTDTHRLTLLLIALLWATPVLAQSGVSNGEWPAYAADGGSTKYSALSQIDRGNVAGLEVAWRWLAANFGPEPEAQRPVRELVEQFLQHWPGEWNDTSDTNAPHEAATLSLAIDKACQQLGWQPVWDFATTVQRTACWYHQRHIVKTEDLHGLSLAQLEAFTSDATKQDIVWAK